MDATCLTCGAWAPIEAHHVAGRRNHADLLVPVCVDCHRILSIWQRAAGIDLDDSPDRSPLDVDRALLLGLTHLIELFALRHPDIACLPAPLVRLMGRASSRLLDAGQDPNRPRRWTPDPTARRPPVTQARWDRDVETRLVSEWAYLLNAVVGLLGLVDGATQENFQQIGHHPARFLTAFADASDDPARAEALFGFTAQAQRFRETVMLFSRAILADPEARAAVDLANVQDVITGTLRIALATLPATAPALTQSGEQS